MRVDGRPVDLGHARQRCVLAALLVEPNRPVPVEQLLDRVWGERPPQRARDTLYSYLSRLRQILAAAGDPRVARSPGGYFVAVDPMAVDLHRFRRLVVQARTESPPAAAALLEQALALWRGDAFATLDTAWFDDRRAELDGERLAAELDHTDLALGQDRHGELLAEVTARAARHPLDERCAAHLMLTLHRCGRQADALEAYEATRRRLAAELGIDPGEPLRRVRQTILTADAPPPVEVVPQAVAPVPRQLPAPPRSFAGRERELARLTGAVDAAAVVISAIGGAGGMGKTWLATRWAHDNLDRFPDGQLYVDLRGFDPSGDPVSPAVALRSFLDALGVGRGAIPVDPAAQSALYRSLVADRRMLVLLDNAADSAQVTPLLPGSASCTVLITSRRTLTTVIAAHGGRPLPLDVLSDAEALDLLTLHLGADRVAAEPDAVAAIVDGCAGLPLALGILAARAAIAPGLPLAALVAEIREDAGRLDAFDAGEVAVNLRAVLAWSYGTLRAEEARLFRLLGLAAAPDIGLPAVAGLAGLTTARARALLRDLVDAHLVQENLPGRYRMHDLVRLYAAELADGDDPEAVRTARRRLFDHYLHTGYAAAVRINRQRHLTLGPPEPGAAPRPIDDAGAAMAWFDAEHQVLIATIDQAAAHGFAAHSWQLAWVAAEYLDRRGHWHARAGTQRTALEATERADDRLGQAHASLGLGGAYGTQGRHEEAETYLRRAIDLFGDLGEHLSHASTELALAGVFERQARHREALAHTRHAMELFELAGHESGVANALNGIGWLHTELGDHEGALASCDQALALHRKLGHHRGEAFTWDSLGYVHHHLGHLDEAIDCYHKALDMYREMGERYREAETLDHVGDTELAAGRRDAARLAWHRSAAVLEELGHTQAAAVRAKLAGLA
jgi:DNA-binding SARP family transcriptional activator/Tfp pilus assembly protein PilF